MNFIESYKKGQQGKNIGLPMGIETFNKAMGGVHRKSLYGIAAGPKVGKSTFSDFSFLLHPYLYKVEHPNIEIDFIYFSLEVDLLDKMNKIASFFFYHDYQISHFGYLGKEYEMNASYLRGKVIDHLGNMIPVSKEHHKILKEIYYTRLAPLFGEYSSNGIKIKNGTIDFITNRQTPTTIKNYLYQYALKNGQFHTEKYDTLENGTKTTKTRIVSYVANNPDKYVIIIVDHLRKLIQENGQTIKSNIDNLLHNQVEIRNMCGFTFVDVIHLNRKISDVDRLKYFSDKLYPNGDDVKETGNLSEEADYLFTLFNPQDEKYNLKTHFGTDLANYPNYRSLHLVESRHCECPLHTRMNIYPYINYFKPITT